MKIKIEKKRGINIERLEEVRTKEEIREKEIEKTRKKWEIKDEKIDGKIIPVIFVSAIVFLLQIKGTMKFVYVGDPFSDSAVLLAGENFEKYGFIKLKFQPVYSRKDLSPYTHYPPLPEWVNGLLRKIGISSVIYMKFISLFISIFGALFFRLLVKELFGNKIAIFSLLFFITHQRFLDYSTSLHGYPYYTLFVPSSLYFLLGYFSGNRAYLYFSLIASYLNGLSFYNFIPFCLFFSFALSLKERKFFPFVLITLSYILSFFTRFLINAWSLGVEGAFYDLFSAFLLRTMGEGEGEWFMGKEFSFTPNFLFYLLVSNLVRIERWFGFGSTLLVIFWLINFFRFERKRNIHLLIFFLSPLPWIFIFLQHVYVHPQIDIAGSYLFFFSIFYPFILLHFWEKGKENGIFKVISILILFLQFDRVLEEVGRGKKEILPQKVENFLKENCPEKVSSEISTNAPPLVFSVMRVFCEVEYMDFQMKNIKDTKFYIVQKKFIPSFFQNQEERRWISGPISFLMKRTRLWKIFSRPTFFVDPLDNLIGIPLREIYNSDEWAIYEKI